MSGCFYKAWSGKYIGHAATLTKSHRSNCRLSVLPPTFKPVLQQIRLLQVAGIPTSDWIKLDHAGVTPYTRVTSFFEKQVCLGLITYTDFVAKI